MSSKTAEDTQDQVQSQDQGQELVESVRQLRPDRPVVRAYVNEAKLFGHIQHRYQYEEGRMLHFFFGIPVRYSEGRFFIETRGEVPKVFDGMITDFTIKATRIGNTTPLGAYKTNEATAVVAFDDDADRPLIISIAATNIKAAYGLYFNILDRKLFPLEVCGGSEAEQRQKAAELLVTIKDLEEQADDLREQIGDLQRQLREKEKDRKNAHATIVDQLGRIDDLKDELAILRQKLVPWYRKVLTFLQRMVNVRA